MGQDEILWEPVWDFSQPGEPPIPATLPYSLDDTTYISWLKKNFRFVLQLCLRFMAPTTSGCCGATLLLNWAAISILA